MDSFHKWQLKAGMALDELKKREWRKVLKSHFGEGTSLGFRIPRGRENINHAVFAGSNAIQDQLVGEEDVCGNCGPETVILTYRKSSGCVT